MGVDFGGSGPVYALGDGVVTNAEGDSSGWPGGGWITYRLTSGPAAGLMVYVAEDVTPDVQVGQTVTSSTVVANMFNGGDGIETGWAMSDGASAESEMPEAGGIGGGGPFPTMVGLNFDELLQALGVPAAPNAGQAGNGALPSNYPTDWASALKP
jgi:murein DD-endopeptidase MepM/ murein hydrolase activator NlpD